MGWRYTDIAEDLCGKGYRKGNISHKLGYTLVFKAFGLRGTRLLRRMGRASFLLHAALGYYSDCPLSQM